MSNPTPDVVATNDTAVSSLRRFALVGSTSLYGDALKSLIERTVASSTVAIVDEPVLDPDHVDVILLDVDLDRVTERRMQGLSDLLKKLAPRPVLLISEWVHTAVLQRLLRDGAAGLVLKSSRSETLLDAIESVSSGKVWLQRDVLAETFADSSHGRRGCGQADKIAQLTNRELEIIAVAACGLTNKQMAEKLHISEPTVRHHLNSIFSKLQVANRGELIIFAFRHRLADPADPSHLC
jgi:two-component system nitrate/nitrite response regulator NarL